MRTVPQDAATVSPTRKPTAEEVAESALAWVWYSMCQYSPSWVLYDKGDSFREMCRRLGGRFAQAVEEYERLEGEIARESRAITEERERQALEAREDQRLYESLKPRVFERDGGLCLRCGSNGPLCGDHVMPRSKGGETSMDNLQTLCLRCNNVKGVKTGVEWDFRRTES